MMRSAPGEIIVCGIGNLLLHDEGEGVHVARALQASSLPSLVKVLEAGTSLLDFVCELQEARQIILVDAMRGGGAPGTIYVVDAQQCTQGRGEQAFSLHQVGVAEVLRLMALKGKPPPYLIVGIEPAHVDWGLDLSETIKGRLPQILEVAREQVRRSRAQAEGEMNPS